MYYSTYTDFGKKPQMEIVKQIVENKVLLATSGSASVVGGAVVSRVKEVAVEPTLMESIATNGVAIGAICISIQTLLAVLKFGLDRFLKYKERKKARLESANRDNICKK